MRWMRLGLRNSETLQCDRCDTLISGQYLYLSSDEAADEEEIEEVLCEHCWNELGDKE